MGTDWSNCLQLNCTASILVMLSFYDATVLLICFHSTNQHSFSWGIYPHLWLEYMKLPYPSQTFGHLAQSCLLQSRKQKIFPNICCLRSFFKKKIWIGYQKWNLLCCSHKVYVLLSNHIPSVLTDKYSYAQVIELAYYININHSHVKYA